MEPEIITAQDTEFTDAFKEFADVPAPATPAVTEPAAVVPPVTETPVSAVPAATEPAVVVPPVTETPVPVAPAATEPAAVVPPVTETPEYTALREEIAAIRAAQPAEPAPAAAPIYSTDEQAAVAKYQEDWPDIAKGEALLRRAEYRELVGYIFQQVHAQYAPALEFASTQADREQYNGIVALVPDYNEVRDKTLAWIETQPPALRATFEKIADEGTPADVAGLINYYKHVTGQVIAAAAPAVPVAPAAPVVTPPAAAPVAELSPAAKAAGAKLAVVKSSRSEPTQGKDDNDFKGAFEEFAAKEQRASRK